MDKAAHKFLQFDRFRLDLGRGCLRTADQEIALRPKVFDVLRHLAENAGRLVPKQELYDAVWPNVVVTDDSLVQCIRELRNKLDDDAHHLIKTVSRRGYLLNVAASTSDSTDALFSQPSTTGASNGHIAFPSSLSDRPSIAVLPFDVIGSDPRAGDLADGLTEDLTTAMAKVPELLVIARHSTSTYKGKAVKVQEVAEALGVRYVLEGSIQKHGNRMRITPQLIDAENGHHLWAERYDRPMEDVFALQDEIVRQVLIELQVKLTAGDSARIASRGTNNLKAWLLRVEGYAETAKYTREGMVRARALLEEANRADPNWARPVAGIALTHEREALRGWSASREESIRLGIEHAERAITMESQDPLGYQVLGNLHILLGDYESAIVLGEKAVSIAPNDVLALGGLGGKLVLVGEAERAIAVFERAVRVCPVLPRWPQHRYGLALLIAGHVKRAITVLEDLVRREHDFLLGRALLAAVYVEAGRLDAATAATKTLLEQDPTFTISDYLTALPFQDEQCIEWLRTLLVKAGLPE